MHDIPVKLDDEKAAKATPFPWDNVMAFGFAVLKLSSAEFWAMTPREIAYAMRAFAPRETIPLSRDHLNRLMRRFPDKEDKR